MAAKETAEATPLEVTRSNVGTLHLVGLDLPYVNLDAEPQMRSRLRVGQTEYAYQRSMPVQGHSATMPETVVEMQSGGGRVLIAERNDRYLLYLSD